MAEDPTTAPEKSDESVIEDADLGRKPGAEDEASYEEEQLPESWFITGANGNLGQRLVRKLLSEGADVTAVVRSTRAERELSRAVNFNNKLRIEVIDYSETMLLGQAAYGAQFAVHLVGILKATKDATYARAHEASCTSLSRALKGTSVEHITYLSILGARPSSSNPCLASKGRAERILYRSATPACTLRIPMVIGERDYTTKMLAKRASLSTSFTFRAGSLEQPIFADDVIEAICSASRLGLEGGLNLAGPESLTRAQLYSRAAQVLGNSTKVRSIPMFLGYTMAWLLELFMADPPVTRAMLGVLDHDDDIRVDKALRLLEIENLTPLDVMLRQALPRT